MAKARPLGSASVTSRRALREAATSASTPGSASIDPSVDCQSPRASRYSIVAVSGIADSRSSPRISAASSGNASTTDPICIGAMTGDTTTR